MKSKHVRFMFSVVLALWALALSAQTHWTVNDNFANRMTIYYELMVGDDVVTPEDRTTYEVVALINDDCRGRGEFITVDGHTYGQMMVFGDADDEGKQLTFMVYDKANKEEKRIYGVNILYANDGIVGYPSQPQAFDVNFNYLPGDANNDGKVSSADVVAVVKYILSDGATTINEAAADLSGDGKISSADVVAIVRLILNNE